MNDTEIPLVSVVIPCRNEAGFIASCLDSVVGNDYPKGRIEVLVVDGMSEDGTREIVDEYSRRHGFIRRLDNPKRVTPAALNVGIRAAAGRIIVRVDAHASIGKDYVRRCVEALSKYGADNVGGIMYTIPRRPGLVGESIAASLSHRFGVGNSYFRIHSRSVRSVDTVFGGCYAREVFDRVGLFNEALPRGQDMEFNLRLKRAGGRIVLDPQIVSSYYARSDLVSFWRHNWGNGVWAVLPFLYSTVTPVSWRHLVPAAFVSAVVISAAATPAFPPAGGALAALFASYGAASIVAGADVAWRKRDARYLAVMPFVFASLHVAYGLGSLWGLVHLAAKAGGARRRMSTGEAERC